MWTIIQEKKQTTHTQLINLLIPVQKQNQQNAQLLSYEDISFEQLQTILRKYVSYGTKEQNSSKDLIFKTDDQKINLKIPRNGQSRFSNMYPLIHRFKNIMREAYKQEQLRSSQFKQFQPYFKLNKNQIKLVNYPDLIILQTLRFAIFNKQYIPPYLVTIVIQMAKAKLGKEREFGLFLLANSITYSFVVLGLEPPLDLYVQFIKTKLIQPTKDQLIEVFTKNQLIFNILYKNQEIYQTKSKKKLVILNQLPYLLQILNYILAKDPSKYNFFRLQIYLNTILNTLKFTCYDDLFERYLPEVKCRYIKIKSNLNFSDIQYLFTVLKMVENLTMGDFKILYPTINLDNQNIQSGDMKSWTQFGKVWELCQRILQNKNISVISRQLQQLGEHLNYQKCFSQSIIKVNLIFVIFRESAFKKQFPKSLIKKILWTLNCIPDKKKKKQCCFILLIQYFKLMKQNPEKVIQIIKRQQQLDTILNEGKQLALDLLLSLQYIKFAFTQEIFFYYVCILQKLIINSKSLTIRSKAVQLYQKIKLSNNQKYSSMKFYEQNITKAYEVIKCIESQTKNGQKLNQELINNIIKIFYTNNLEQVKRSCLKTLRNVVKNHKKGKQPLSNKFVETLIQLVSNQDFKQKTTQYCTNQIIKLVIQCTFMATLSEVINIMKLLFQVYFNSPVNSCISINSSFGIYIISANFCRRKHTYPMIKDFFYQFLNKSLLTCKVSFQLSKNKGKLNILCAIVALAKNQVLLPVELIDQLTVIPLSNKHLTEIVLLAVLFYTRNTNCETISQISLLNICSLLPQLDQKAQYLVTEIIYKFYKQKKYFPNSVIKKIEEATKAQNGINGQNERLRKLLNQQNQIQTIQKTQNR